MVCEGHAEIQAVRDLLRKASLAESGTSVSLNDAATLTTNNAKFPVTIQMAVEKLYAWSVAIDVFHGANHPVATSVRYFVIEIGPQLHRLAGQYAGAQAPIGVELANRAIYEAQQDYFGWASRAAVRLAGIIPAVPAFSRILNLVGSFRADALSTLPPSWYSMFEIYNPKAGTSERRQGSQSQGGSSTPNRRGANLAPTFNTHADGDLVTRFRNSEYDNISDMMSGKDVTIPKHAGKEVCLTWALKGECASGCRRGDQHVTYSRATNQKLGAFLTDCGVPATQQ